MTDPDLFLASRSPRRRELLRQIGVRHAVIDIQVPEQHQPGESAQDYVQRLAIAKASAGAHAVRVLGFDRPVLGADTLVVCDGDILEKPRDRADGVRMLQRLSGRVHQVMTAVALSRGQQIFHRQVVSDVRLRVIDAAEAERYWDTGEPQDKAGGYAIQGLGAVFVEHLSGSYSNVVGLPLLETRELLQAVGVPVWQEVDA